MALKWGVDSRMEYWPPDGVLAPRWGVSSQYRILVPRWGIDPQSEVLIPVWGDCVRCKLILKGWD